MMVSSRRKCHDSTRIQGSSLLFYLAILVLLQNSKSNSNYSLGNNGGFVFDVVVVDAFGALNPRRNNNDPGVSVSSDHPVVTRRDSLAQLSFLTTTTIAFTANIGLVGVLTNADPAFALSEVDDANSIKSNINDNANANANANGDGLSLAKPMGPSDNSRPSAPLEYLLPAARVGIYIYQALAIVEEVGRLQQEATTSAMEDSAAAKAKDKVAKLDTLFLSPPPFIKSDDPTVSRRDQYGKNSLPIVGEIGVAAQKQQERRDRSIDVGFAPQFFEVGELVGERRQWNQLQRAEREREGASEVRRAFNIYTTNLNFSRTEYKWVGSTEEKSRRIRSDRLPTTTDVIRSDLDARDLYRNQVQTALEDARAEWVYQMKECNDYSSNSSNSVDLRKFDTTELQDILKQAQVSVDKWFGFIPDQDVKLALETVVQQKEQV